MRQLAICRRLPTKGAWSIRPLEARFDRFSDTLFELVSNAGVKASAYLLMGDFVAEVPRFVGERRCDLVVLTGREGRGLLGAP